MGWGLGGGDEGDGQGARFTEAEQRMGTQQESARDGGRRRRRAWWISGGVTAGVLAVVGCSVDKHYEVLSFFFDGVPDPNKKAEGQSITGARAVDIRESPTYSVHKPYAENQCNECHSSRLRLSKSDSSVCLKCHAGTTTEHAVMHGPVAVGACLWCHEPHESANASLLQRPGRGVCVTCHEAGLLNATRVAAHADDSRSCLECHFGHGGERAYFLREVITNRGAGDGSGEPAVSPER